MHRIYIPIEHISETVIYFPEEQCHRIKKVLRLKPGDILIVFDGQGKEYRVSLANDTHKELIGNIESITAINREAGLRVTLMQGVPKFEKMDYIVQKATELGVYRIIPVITERTIPQLTISKMKLRSDRWQKIAIAAAEQCGRTVIPIISPITDFEIGLDEIKSQTMKLLFWEEERTRTLKSVIRTIDEPESVVVIIGPEGGLTRGEADSAVKVGAISVSLGSRLLRTETAPITALSIVFYEFSED
ncbi:MAG: 16S rRNA (uracil(1498)-N(3))-methyltransferase [bacterium]